MGKVERFCIFVEKIRDMTISFILKRSKAGFTMDDAEGGAKREEIKANIVCNNEGKAELNEKLQNLKKYLYSKYKTDKEKGKVNKEWLAKALKDFAKQQGKLVDQTNDRSNSFQERFQEFLNANDFSEGRVISIVS